MTDLLAEYSLNLSPYNYCRSNPILYADLFGLQDTLVHPPLPDVTVRPTRVTEHSNAAKEWGIIFFLREGGSNGTNPLAWGPWMLWDVDLFEMLNLWLNQKGFEKPSRPTAEEMAEKYLEAAANSVKENKDEKVIKSKAGNNTKLIENNPLVKLYKIVPESKYPGSHSITTFRSDSVIYKTWDSGKPDTTIEKWANEKQLFKPIE